jgi:hypothetical protein
MSVKHFVLVKLEGTYGRYAFTVSTIMKVLSKILLSTKDHYKLFVSYNYLKQS